jgi:hypothetical protein
MIVVLFILGLMIGFGVIGGGSQGNSIYFFS